MRCLPPIAQPRSGTALYAPAVSGRGKTRALRESATVGVGAEYPIPDRGAHAIAATFTRVMVFQVVMLDELRQAVAHREVVRGVVDIVIDQVADDKSATERLNPRLWHEQPEQQV